ncbi:MAG TPA: FtsX-like permease family protein [Coriobacteriia bacterium]|nr:FtsX-like permease family protein [Coriobacteriia bacterium]
MLSLRIAWRFLRSAPVQSVLIIAGIAVGISAQIFVGSLIQSLQGSLVDQTIGSAPQVTIQALEEGDPVTYDDRMAEVIENDDRVEPGSIAKIRTVSSLYSDGTDSAPLNLIGSTIAELNGIYDVSNRIEDGEASLRSDEILVGTDFAEKFGLEVGDDIRLTFQNGNPSTFSVAGIFDLGAAAFNERQAFVNPDVPASLLGWSSNEYSTIDSQLNEPFASAEVAADWRRELAGVEVVEWQAQNADLLTALQSQSSSSYLIQTFVLVAVALGIASTLAISAVQKTRQIGILKAMGMADGASGRIFLYQALLLGGIGSLSGVVLATLFIWLFSFVPVSFAVVMQPWFVLLSASIGVLVALASSIIPIRGTSKLDPIEVIQNG